MKRLILLSCAVILASQAKAQDPDLFQKWYLYQMAFEDGTIINVEGWDSYFRNPPIQQISPYLIIDEESDFNGFGICNSFEGTFEDPLFECFPQILNFSQTTDSCGFYEDEFEGYYFGFFAPSFAAACFSISSNGDGFQTLILDGSIFSTFTFRNIPILAISEFNQPEISVYPNPASNLINITSEYIKVERLVVYSISGKKLFNQVNTDSAINVSGLPDGLYFLEITTPRGKIVQKFIKN